MGKFFNALRSENVATCFCFGVCVLGGYLGVRFGIREVAMISALAPLLSPIVFFGVLARNRKWRREYEVEKYLNGGRTNPFHKWLVWIPSALALFVLLFLPVASHAIAPLSGYFAQHRIPVPWNVLVGKVLLLQPEMEGLLCFVP